MLSILKKIETFQINNITLHLQELGEQQQTKPSASRRKKIIKITAELNDIETKRAIQRVNNSRSWFFDKKNKIDNPLTRLIEEKKREDPISKSEMKEEKLQLILQKYKGL